MVTECPSCGKRVDGQAIGQYEYHDPGEGAPCRITLLRCARCHHPIVAREEERWTGMWSNPETVYPHQVDDINPDLPEHLRSMCREARACYRAGAPTASALMCRKTLEGICVEHGITERNLAASLKRAKEAGLIDGRLYEWADELRVAGNEAAHDVTADFSGEDARDLLEFTEALLEYVFTFRDRFDRFQQRRKARKQQGSASANERGA